MGAFKLVHFCMSDCIVQEDKYLSCYMRKNMLVDNASPLLFGLDITLFWGGFAAVHTLEAAASNIQRN